MLEIILNDFNKEIKQIVDDLYQQLEQTFDFTEIEKILSKKLNEFSALLSKLMLTQLFKDEQFLKHLKSIAGRLGMHYVRHRTITVQLSSGESIKILSPYFLKALPKKRKKKKKHGSQGKGHVGLSALGFIGLCSGNLASEVVKLAILCPSFEVAESVLAERGILMDDKTIRRLCRDLGQLGLEGRGAISLDGTENLDGETVVIGIDGGRLRERKPKRGRKKEGQKRQGYHTEWREPKQFVIYLLDSEGNVKKSFRPLYDGTMDDHNGMFLLLEHYLEALDLSSVKRIVFCGDGSPWIWNDVEKICEKLAIDTDKVYQSLDYTHAKQNLQEIINLIPKNNKRIKIITKNLNNLLWKGDINGIFNVIADTFKDKLKEKALKKWKDYFDGNKKRMQYQTFREKCIPCGSGCIESAIRRVINMRLKSAGSFWKEEMAEYFLFLRSQLLSGRWLIFIKNVTRRLVFSMQYENEIERTVELQEAA